MSNPFKNKNLVRGTWCVGVGVLATLACGPKKSDQTPTPQVTAPLPTAGIAGQRVPLMPLGLVAAEDTLHWDALIADRRGTLDKSDSIINTFLTARAPEVNWVSPGEVRRIAHRARYILVPAGLVFRRAAVGPSGRQAVAELAIVLIDTRTGKIGWRTTARGEGEDPWTALTRAVKNLTPGVP